MPARGVLTSRLGASKMFADLAREVAPVNPDVEKVAEVGRPPWAESGGVIQESGSERDGMRSGAARSARRRSADDTRAGRERAFGNEEVTGSVQGHTTRSIELRAGGWPAVAAVAIVPVRSTLLIEAGDQRYAIRGGRLAHWKSTAAGRNLSAAPGRGCGTGSPRRRARP